MIIDYVSGCVGAVVDVELVTVSLFRSELKMNVQICHRLQSYLND